VCEADEKACSNVIQEVVGIDEDDEDEDEDEDDGDAFT